MLSDCSSFTVDQYDQEQLKHGTTAFPAACYLDDLELKSVSWHWHEEFEVVIVAEGQATVIVGSRTQDICTGNGFLVNTGTLHSYHTLSGSVCRLHSLVFHPRLVGGSMESIFYQKYVQPIVKHQTMDVYFLDREIPWQATALKTAELAWQTGVQEPLHFELQIRNCLSKLMADLCDHIPAEQTKPNAGLLRSAERMKQMLKFIQENFAEELSTAVIASSASVSESECLRCFRTVIGTTPIQYLREYRIERAAQLLAESPIQISEVAFRCGFQDVSYFTKTFRKLRGCTPSEFQKLCLNRQTLSNI